MIIEWTQDLATGNEEIDSHHQEIFKRFNEFQLACSQGKAREELFNLLTFLDSYVKFHFSTEEALQLQHGYPGYEAHREEHLDFIQKLQKLEEQLEAFGATPTLVIQTNMALISWLVRHISGTDKGFTSFFAR